MPSPDVASGVITEAMIYTAIADVLDPELDESLVKLGFIDSVRIDGSDVTLTFKLPTYWCAPNFAYLMASDLRARIKDIPHVSSVRILLVDHCADDEVSTGVNTGKSFLETFPDEAEDNLEELRLIFLRKGFLMRQDALLRRLQQAGFDEAALLALRVADLVIEPATGYVVVTTPHQVARFKGTAQIAQAYLRRARALGLYQEPHDLLFVDEHSQAIPPGGLQAYLRQSRSVRMNIMFNTVFCSDMFQTRYGPGTNKVLSEGDRA